VVAPSAKGGYFPQPVSHIPANRFIPRCPSDESDLDLEEVLESMWWDSAIDDLVMRCAA